MCFPWIDGSLPPPLPREVINAYAKKGDVSAASRPQSLVNKNTKKGEQTQKQNQQMKLNKKLEKRTQIKNEKP